MPSKKTTTTTKADKAPKTPEKKMKTVTTPKTPVKKSKKEVQQVEAVPEPAPVVVEEPVVPQEGEQQMVQARKKTPYNFFVSQQMKKLGAMDEWKDQKKSDLMKECGNIWKGMSDKEKAPFMKQAEQQEVVMKPVKAKKAKKEKSDKPKKVRAKTPYNFFVSEQMKKLNAMSEWKEKKNSELMKECGNIWKSLSDKSKAPYQKQAEAFKAELAKQTEVEVEA